MGKWITTNAEPEMGLAKAQETTKRIVDPNIFGRVGKTNRGFERFMRHAARYFYRRCGQLGYFGRNAERPGVFGAAEDLQAGSSYNIPANTQQAFGRLRAADEIIDEGHFIGKALGEAMNGYRPIVELMNANFGIYGMGGTLFRREHVRYHRRAVQDANDRHRGWRYCAKPIVRCGTFATVSRVHLGYPWFENLLSE